MTTVRYIAGAVGIGGLFVACALAIKNWHQSNPNKPYRCRDCGEVQVYPIKSGLGPEWQAWHRDMHRMSRLIERREK